ncbi:hypothetical protein EU555_33070 [Methylobacterium nonmethylotrophicum]|uniref:Uncharacterized protein n=1 Tax=Methylobacterium nonmethylotrophicum TaxID=1141884 RepID=A0A4Z0NFS8_9HYPH|nr:hypothetical protein EU555_33070 [Methylobacterium nonmethylotrophicum]
MSTGYRLPRAVADRLETALSGRKNAPACLALAHFLARFWSSPRRLLCAFPIDRRALAEHEGLGLTEARVRGALAVLVEVGFLARYEPDPGKRYQRTEGGLQRRAILHRFGEEYGVEFGKANARAQAARGAPALARRPIPRPEPQRAPAANLAAPLRPAILPERPRTVSASQLAQKQNSPGRGVVMGEDRGASALEDAIERLRRGIGL